MIITHKIPWNQCLSHTIWPCIEKGWKDNGSEIHFFWGLAGNNKKEIQNCIKNDKEWWYVDNGYLTEQITRYPAPIIHESNKTYFRICKGALHSENLKPSSGVRRKELIDKGIDCQFKGWKKEGEYVLLCPSSPDIVYWHHAYNQNRWTIEAKKNLDETFVFRNKPRPNNEWWNTDIKDDLEKCKYLICDMSLASVDAIVNGVPVICDPRNVAAPLSSSKNDIVYHEEGTVNSWLDSLADNQFTLDEISNGTAYQTLEK